MSQKINMMLLYDVAENNMVSVLKQDTDYRFLYFLLSEYSLVTTVRLFHKYQKYD